MPIYAYRCESCGHAKDVLQKISDPLLTTCPACGAEQFKKQVTSAGFQLKGSGWYVTDFRGGAASAASEGGKEAGKESTAAKPASDKSAGDKSAGDKSAGDKSADAAASPSGTPKPAPVVAPAASTSASAAAPAASASK
jgi:putative FmdB family regulatory protein